MYKETDPKIHELRLKLAKKGIFALYGGRKGHGFWLYDLGERLAHELTLSFAPDRFWNICDALEETPIIKNDGKKSGNPCFWLFKDAQDLAGAPAPTFNIRCNVGTAKYLISFHDGEKTHTDGSPFFDIRIFSNKKKLDAFTRELKLKGYTQKF